MVLVVPVFNPIALRKTKIAYNLAFLSAIGLSLFGYLPGIVVVLSVLNTVRYLTDWYLYLYLNCHQISPYNLLHRYPSF